MPQADPRIDGDTISLSHVNYEQWIAEESYLKSRADVGMRTAWSQEGIEDRGEGTLHAKEGRREERW